MNHAARGRFSHAQKRRLALQAPCAAFRSKGSNGLPEPNDHLSDQRMRPSRTPVYGQKPPVEETIEITA
jgi:hypothetical protein